jgi:hypothetical protein
LKRTIGSSFGVSTQADIKLLTASVGLNAEIKSNICYTTSINQVIYVPPYTTYYGKAGTKRVYGRAKKYYVDSNCQRNFVKAFNYDYGYNYEIKWWE